MARRSPWELPQALLARAQRQGGCVTVAQAAAAGLNANAIARRVRHGRSTRHVGCIVLDASEPRDRHVLDAWAMTLRIQPIGVVVSGSTALHLMGRRPLPKLVECRIARVSQLTKRRLPGMTLMLQRVGDRAPSRSIRGLLVHHPAQALLDIIKQVAPDAARAWLNWALHERLVTEHDLRCEVSRVASLAATGSAKGSRAELERVAPSTRDEATPDDAKRGASPRAAPHSASQLGSTANSRDSTAKARESTPRGECGAPGRTDALTLSCESTDSHAPTAAPPLGSTAKAREWTAKFCEPSALGEAAPRAIPLRASTKGARVRTRLQLALNHVAGGTRSEAEERLKRILRAGGIRGIRSNWPVAMRHDAAPFARLDMAHPAAKLAIEVDGRAFHSAHEAFERDRERQGQLAELGWLTIRFTWSMLVSDPARVVARVRSVIEGRVAAVGAAPR